MARSVAWTELASQDLERIVDHLVQDSPTFAAGLARRAWEQAETLVELPRRGRVVPELGDPAVRELILWSYRLLYEIREETVFVIGLIHGARDLGALWSREGERRRRPAAPAPPH